MALVPVAVAFPKAAVLEANANVLMFPEGSTVKIEVCAGGARASAMFPLVSIDSKDVYAPGAGKVMLRSVPIEAGGDSVNPKEDATLFLSTNEPPSILAGVKVAAWKVNTPAP